MIVTPALAALLRASLLLADRLRMLEERIAAGEDVWPEYAAAAVALAQLAPAVGPGANGRLMSTAELAATMNVSPKTILRRKKAGQLAPAAQLSKRTLRWKSA